MAIRGRLANHVRMSESAQRPDAIADELHQLQPALGQELAHRLAVVLDERLLDEQVLGQPGLQLGQLSRARCYISLAF
jgi:hypothetical protein